jgi:hypothetical protein
MYVDLERLCTGQFFSSLSKACFRVIGVILDIDIHAWRNQALNYSMALVPARTPPQSSEELSALRTALGRTATPSVSRQFHLPRLRATKMARIPCKCGFAIQSQLRRANVSARLKSNILEAA